VVSLPRHEVVSLTGISISDGKKITEANFDGDLISVVQTKTKNKVDVPLHALAKDLFFKHDGFKNIIDQNFNKKIKVVMRDFFENLALTYPLHPQYTFSTYIKGGENTGGRIPKWQAITAHIARHSLISILASNPNVSNAELSAIAGHKDYRSTRRYIKPVRKLNMNNLLGLSDSDSTQTFQ